MPGTASNFLAWMSCGVSGSCWQPARNSAISSSRRMNPPLRKRYSSSNPSDRSESCHRRTGRRGEGGGCDQLRLTSAHRIEEIRIIFGGADFIQQKLRRFQLIHRVQELAQHPDLLQDVLLDEQL